MSRAIGLTEEQIASSVIDERTKLPEGLEWMRRKINCHRSISDRKSIACQSFEL